MWHPQLHPVRWLAPPRSIAARLTILNLLIMAYSASVALFARYHELAEQSWGVESTVLNGLVISLLLSFRNNEASKRWWEARQLWGQLINDLRNFCQKVRVHVPLDELERRTFGMQLAAFAVALRRHLRGGASLQAIPGFERCLDHPSNVPFYLAGLIHGQLAAWKRDRLIDGFTLQILDPHAKALLDVQGACERIRNTPLPGSYLALLRHGLLLYLAITPWVLVGQLDLWVVPVMAVVAYFLIGIELTAEDIEEPFGRDGDDLDLESYCRTIESSIAATLGPVPEDMMLTRKLQLK